MVKNLPANAGDTRDIDSIPGSARFPGGRNGNPFQYSCLDKFYGQRSLEGYSSWGHKGLDLPECAYTHTHSDFNVQQELKTTGEAEMFQGDSSERNWKVFLLVGRKQNYLNSLLLFPFVSICK